METRRVVPIAFLAITVAVLIVGALMGHSSVWSDSVLWVKTLMFGRGAIITPAPVNIPAGDSYLQASTSMVPVSNAMSVGLDIGPATGSNKRAVLNGSMKLSDVGKVEVAICRSRIDCLQMTYSGPYFSKDRFGIGYDINGLNKNAKYVGVRISTDRPLAGVIVSWSNYVQ